MVTSTAFATRFGGSVCPEIPWSVCPETLGQLAPKWCGLIHHNLQARELLLNGDIDSKDYKEIKVEAEQKIISIESKLADLNSNNFKISEVAVIVDKAVENLTKLNIIYCNSGSAEKRELIGSIFSEKFTFEDLEHRTASISDSYNVIYLINKQLQGKKKGQRPEKSVLSHRVIPLGLEPSNNWS